MGAQVGAIGPIGVPRLLWNVGSLPWKPMSRRHFLWAPMGSELGAAVLKLAYNGVIVGL